MGCVVLVSNWEGCLIITTSLLLGSLAVSKNYVQIRVQFSLEVALQPPLVQMKTHEVQPDRVVFWQMDVSTFAIGPNRVVLWSSLR